MNVVSSPTMQTGLKKIRVFLIFGILFLLVALGLGSWSYTISTKQSNAIKLNSLIIDEVKDSTFASLEVASVPYAFAEYDDTTDKYYFVFDQENLMYIVYLPRNTYYTLDDKDIENHPITIEGMTKPIPSDIRKLAIEVYNEANEEEFLTDENFEKYLGSIYLDTTAKPNDYTVQLIFAIVSGVFGLLFIFLSFFTKKRSKKVIAKFTNDEWKKIEAELESEETISYKSLNLHFTENYVIVLSSGIDIFSYQDILWMYPYVMKQYGITTNKDIILVTRDKKRHSIANVSNFSKKSKEQYNDIMSFIHDKNPNCLVGYTKENIQEMKHLYGIK